MGDMNKQPDAFCITAHLFGRMWSPSCCTYVLRRTVEDNGDAHSKATRAMALRNFHVDNCLKSLAMEKETVELVQQLPPLLQTGVQFTKWTTNSPTFLISMSPNGDGTSGRLH